MGIGGSISNNKIYGEEEVEAQDEYEVVVELQRARANKKRSNQNSEPVQQPQEEVVQDIIHTSTTWIIRSPDQMKKTKKKIFQLNEKRRQLMEKKHQWKMMKKHHRKKMHKENGHDDGSVLKMVEERHNGEEVGGEGAKQLDENGE